MVPRSGTDQNPRLQSRGGHQRLKKYLAATGPRTRDSAESHGKPEEARGASSGQAERVTLPVTYFARNCLRHDGLLDITGGSDLVTVSWSRFADHDKAMLIGNSDSATGDRGKLRVTLHHNQFESIVQRAPRVRFGQVHVYDNRYVVPEGSEYRYSLGVSTESGIHAENNAFHTPSHVEVADLVKSWNGTALHQTGTLFNGYPVDLLAIYNAYNSGSERDLTADVGWTPTLHTKFDSAEAADREVARGAGAGRIP
nr:hypothetical protein [Streptomyces sp. NRRL S-646]